MRRRQFRVLVREFLFRMVDLELLSAHALGDSHRLLGQFASLLVFCSIFLAAPSLALGGGTRLDVVFQPIAFEHFVISTTMLFLGLFAVFSWDSTFPDRRDVLVLAPLPVRASTFFLAKVAAVGAALGMTILTLNALPGLLWPLALSLPSPETVVPALTWDAALPAATADDLKPILDRDLAPAMRNGAMAPGTHAGLVIGVSKGGARRVLAYGAARPDSVFEIGSITKTFTGLALARMIVQSKARLDEPVRELLPEGTVRRPYGAEITLLDLATHRSGLPEMPDNLNFEGEENPMADYHLSDLYRYLKRRGVGKGSDAPFAYSSLGAALLGDALAARAGVSYEDLLRHEITEPLGLGDTAITLSGDQRHREIQAYGPHREPLPAWDLDAMAPAGAIRTTAGDVLTYLEANLHPEKLPDDLPAAIRLSHIPRAAIAPGNQIALAWIEDVDEGTFWHNGAISGYTAYAFFQPRSDVAGVVLFNYRSDAVSFTGLLGQHLRQRLSGQPAVSLASVTVPAMGGRFIDGLRWLGVYWATVAAAGAFIFCCVLGLQGIAAQLLPRRWFLRASSFLQLAVFAALIGGYFTQPVMATPGALMSAQASGPLAWSPSYWFLGLMQQLRGSPLLAPLARRAWIGLAVVLSVTAAAYALSYLRTLRKIVEEPDILPGGRSRGWLPPFGSAPQSAIAQFTIRTLARSRQHRVILAFYLSIGFAMTIFLLRSPEITERILETALADSWRTVSIPILAATLIMTIFWVVGTRVLFSIPKDLRANWIFRMSTGGDGRPYLKATRRALLTLSLAPVLAGSAALCFVLWPWRPAAAHLLALALLGMLLADLSLHAFRKIPFTCSYLPGKSQVHMVILGALGLLYFTLFAVKYERDILRSGRDFAILAAILAVAAIGARWRTASEAASDERWLRFEDTPPDEILTLSLGGGKGAV